MSVFGSSRQFAPLPRFGSNWGQSGHAAPSMPYQSDANDPKRTKRGLKPAVQRSAARTCDVLSFAWEAENRGQQRPTSIQNNSGLPQGLAGCSAAGWSARSRAQGASRRRW